MKNIGIIIELETDIGQIKKNCFGMITLARQKNCKLFALVINADIEKVKTDLETFGIDTIINIVIGQDIHNNPVIRAKAVIKAAQEFNIDTVFGLSTSMGKDLLPRIAATLDAPLVMDCIDINLQPVCNPCQKDISKATVQTKNCLATTLQYSGKTIATIKTKGDIHIFGIKPNSVEPVKAKTSARILKFDIPDLSAKKLKIIKSSAADKNAAINITEADVIIAGGRGIKNSENFASLFQCAKLLKAGVGASRAAVDKGWVPYSMQVGQTGEKVNPKVYIACGISGSIQHFAGMKTSQMVIAITIDKNAPIISNSDYYVVADALKVIPELTKLLEARLQ